ncbi:MAG: amidohydrolase family protein, partial [Lachnospiraceae bacterium]|nr:amidohydrolase family protein [Lachnospiraceae bacterium]
MILIGNGRVVTRQEDMPYLEEGCVLVEDNKISKIGSTKELLSKYPDSEFIDAKGGVIMPGLINAHNHIYSTMSRGISVNGYSPKNFLDILDGMWWNIDRHLTLTQTKYSALATYLDCIKNGVTTVFDHHASYKEISGSLFAIADAAKELGVRTCLCYEISDRDGEEKMREAVKESEDFIHFAQQDSTDMVKAMMGMHASFTLSSKTLEYCAKHKPEEIGYHIHVAEGM